jgi:putative peptidyl-prolyl cis-trans isomerase
MRPAPLAVLAAAFLLSACQSGKPAANPAPAPAPAPAPQKPAPAAPAAAKTGELLNRVRYIIGDEPITELDIEVMKKNLLRMGRQARNLHEEAVNELIRRALVESEARAESILVTDQKIENEVARAKENAGIKDDARFRATVEQETGMPFALWLEGLRYDLIKQQLIQIKITVPQPSEEEMKRYYAQNAARAGMEVRYREIILAPRDGSIAEEARISRLAGEIAQKSRGNPQIFGELARTTPDNVSPLRIYGGSQDYIPVSELAALDRITAGILSTLGPGQLSQAFRDSRGRYVLLLVEGKRPVSFDKVEDRVRQRLYFEKAEQAFVEWIEKKRKNTAVTSFD